MRVIDITHLNENSNIILHTLEEGTDLLQEIDFESPEQAQAILNGPIQCGFEMEFYWTKKLAKDKKQDKIEASYIEIAEMWDVILDDLDDDETIDEAYKRLFKEYPKIFTKEFKPKYIGEINKKYEEYKRKYKKPNLTFKFYVKIIGGGIPSPEFFEKHANVYFTDSDDPDDDESKFTEELEKIAKIFQKEWVEPKSSNKNVVSGKYHSTDENVWRVETDRSLEDYSEGEVPVEIVSPYFNTPSQMLSEMASLFNYMIKKEIYTTSKTGFHVTMSYAGPSRKLNKVKMVLLMNDTYWLDQFKRGPGTDGYEFTQSQLLRLTKEVDPVKISSLSDTQLSKIEKILSPAISSDKYYALHFKEIKNLDQNNLVEFRIAGNKGYHQAYDQIKTIVTQYAAIMEAGYNPEAFKQEYVEEIKKILQIHKDRVNKVESNPLYQLVRRITTNLDKSKKDSILSRATSFIEDPGYWPYDHLMKPLMASCQQLEPVTASESKLMRALVQKFWQDTPSKYVREVGVPKAMQKDVLKKLFAINMP